MDSNDDRRDYLMRILDEGKRFTADLLKENESLRITNMRLKTTVAEMQASGDSNRVAELQARLESSERERDRAVKGLADLKNQLIQTEAENREFAERYLSIEKQNTNLASLYVASYNLHSTLEMSQIVRYINEIIINLIGSECFGLYLLSEEKDRLRLLSHEGLDEARDATLPVQGPVARAIQEKRVIIRREPGGERDPLVCVPLHVQERTLGVIVIYQLLDHKQDLHGTDEELLDLLAAQAATALYSGQMYTSSARKLNTLQGFFELFSVRSETSDSV